MKVYRTLFEAQCALANKKDQQKFEIRLTENDWYTVERVAKALKNITKACQTAAAHEELSEFIDGSLLDEARLAIKSWENK